MLTKERKEEVVKEFGVNEKDTGSIEVQVALITERVKYLTEHFKVHKKDFHSRRGLLKLIGRRRKFLNYLKRDSFQKYKDVISRLHIRG
ncbi:MAG: 30S ribosomal protein S15 [Campylobacterota bacterium]|nr:30S ribosomal protein S15 [Campylobacterota bacterium]